MAKLSRALVLVAVMSLSFAQIAMASVGPVIGTLDVGGLCNVEASTTSLTFTKDGGSLGRSVISDVQTVTLTAQLDQTNNAAFEIQGDDWTVPLTTKSFGVGQTRFSTGTPADPIYLTEMTALQSISALPLGTVDHDSSLDVHFKVQVPSTAVAGNYQQTITLTQTSCTEPSSPPS